MHWKALHLTALSVFILFILTGAGAYAELRIIKSHSKDKDKAGLIKELVELTKTKQNADAIIDSKVEMMEAQYTMTLTASIAESDAGGELDREKISAAQAYYLKRFKELFKERVKYGEIIERAEYEAYDSNFTAAEIKTMIEFYKSPAGKKMVKLTPKLVEETIKKVDSEITPVVTKIVEEIITELRSKDMI